MKKKIIAVCSAKGGVGKSVLAVNLAVALSKKKFKTTAIDASFQFGNLHVIMDLHPMFTIHDAVEQINELDENLIFSYLSPHDSGVYVLPAPSKPEYADLISYDSLNKISNLLLSNSDYLVVDTPPGLTEHNLNFIEKADHILIVTDLEMTSLKNTKSMISVFNALGLGEKIKIIVNRSTMKSLIKAKNVPQILGEESLLYIPNDFKLVSKSINIGIPFVIHYRRSDISKSIFNIADLISED
ncbi:P-loop NTPase [Lutibacter sp. B2]|nr:P-loop NTPase [Lutibacter sp. B2]